MKLPFSFPFGKKEKSQYFLSLLLRDEKANAVIFEEIEGKAHIVGEHEEHFSQSIETASTEDWLELLDKAISAAESSLPPEIETEKTIFGVKENWVEDGKIKREYLVRLKQVSEALGLAPIGFLVIHEAIAHLLSQKEGVPVSSILVELGKNNVAVSLIRAGRIVETKRTPLEDSIVVTTDKILHHFTQYEILPSRIIIFNGRDHEELSQEFIGHTWSKSLPFLHVPQITTLPNGFDARAVLFGAATQMGFELLGAGSVEETIHAKDMEIAEGPQIIKETLESVPDKETSMEEFGFVRDKDIAKPFKKAEIVVEEAKNTLPIREESNVEPYALDVEEEQEERAVEEAFAQPQKRPQSLPPILVSVLGLFQKPASFFKSVRLPLPRMSGRGKIVFVPPVIVLFGIAMLFLYIFLLKATVTIVIDPKVVEQDQAVVLAAGQPSDFEKHIVQIEGVSVSEDGAVTTPATGEKEVGEKAKGTITILSSLTKEQVFPLGTTVKSSNGLLFLLDSDVKIASSSGLSDLKSTKASVTAKGIGKEYNLPSNTKFSVGSFDASQVEAKNETAFSGGSKKEITVVAKADVDKLLQDLPAELDEKAKKNIEQKVSNSKDLIPGIIKTTIAKKELSNEVGEEAASVGLKGTVTYDAFTYDKDSLITFSKNVIQKEGSDFMLSENETTYDFKDVKENKDTITAVLHIKASLIPKMDEQELKEAIAGKTFDETKSMLSKIAQVKSVAVVLEPTLPFLPALLPKKAGNISFLVKTND